MTAIPAAFDGPSVSVHSVEIFRRGARYRSHDREVARAGELSIDIGIAPTLMLSDDARWLRQQVPLLPPLPPLDVRLGIIRSALALFRSGEVSEQSPDDFFDVLQRGCGLPGALIDHWIDLLCSRLDHVASSSGGSYGGIELVSLPANTFVCLEACLAALLRSDAVWIRPSRREPFSATRFLDCLVQAGWPPVRLGMYPTRHDGLLGAVDVTDRAIVFGGSELPKALDRRGHVKVQGPGRTRALIGREGDPGRTSGLLTKLIASQSGRFCTNVGTVLCANDVDSLGVAVAGALDQISIEATADANYPQARPTSRAQALRQVDWIMSRMRPDDMLLTSRPIFVETPAGTALAPSLIKLGTVDGHPLIGMELPFSVACIGEVPEERQSVFCGDAGFIYAIGYLPGTKPANLPTHASVTVIDLDRSPPWP